MPPPVAILLTGAGASSDSMNNKIQDMPRFTPALKNGIHNKTTKYKYLSQ